MTESSPSFRRLASILALAAAGLCTAGPAAAQRAPAKPPAPAPAASAPQPRPTTPPAPATTTTALAAPAAAVTRSADYIVAVVNNELVTQVEVEQRMTRAREEAARSGARLAPDSELRKQVINALVEERVVITYARDSGVRVEEPELERAVANVAQMNKIPVESLRERLKAEGLDYNRFRDNLRDQILAERIREREVVGRIKVSDAEVEQFLDQQRTKKSLSNEINIAQILVAVPEGATVAEALERKAKVDAALARIKGGESFEAVAKSVSEDSNRDRGGVMGQKAADKYPDAFVEAVKPLAVGGVTAQPLRTGAGFHILKLVSRSDTATMTATQTRARHILLRPSARLTPEAAAKRLSELRAQVTSGAKRFEDLARDNSEDGSAANGGDLGWTSPGALVPEFEEAMNKLAPGGISEPLVSRFGVHLIQVQERREVPVDPRQVREQARNTLRERKFDDAYNEWVDELRSRAYIEMREPPQ